jgi:hypothetical protein
MGGAAQAGGPEQPQGNGSGAKAEDVTDVPYEEVK